MGRNAISLDRAGLNEGKSHIKEMKFLCSYMGCTLWGTGVRNPASCIPVPVLSLDLHRNSWPSGTLRKDPWR